MTAALTISETSTLVVSSRQVSTDVQAESVILNLDRGVYYGLDEVGARVWQLLQESVTLHDIRERILDEYEVERDQCETDLRALLGELVDAGLVEVTDRGTA